MTLNLKLLRDASLLQYGVRRVAGENLVVDGKAAVGNGAVPDVVIPATRAVIPASGLAENLLQLRREGRHQDATGTEAVSSWWASRRTSTTF